MGSGEDHGRAPDLRARTSELRSTAAAKGSELRSAAAARGGELRSSAVQRSAELRRSMGSLDVPWARCAPARLTREAFLQGALGPLIDCYTRVLVRGREVFDELPAPVVLVANHASHLDTPTILRALPARWRQRTAVAAAADYFYRRRALAAAVALAFNTVPILRRGGGTSEGAFDHVDRLIDGRWNLLVFPEGTRSRDGGLGRLRSGAALIARRHGIPLVPVRVRGTHEAMPPGRNWPRRVDGPRSRRHAVEVHFGAPIPVGADDDVGLAMTHVRQHLEDRGVPLAALTTTPADPVRRRPPTPA